MYVWSLGASGRAFRESKDLYILMNTYILSDIIITLKFVSQVHMNKVNTYKMCNPCYHYHVPSIIPIECNGNMTVRYFFLSGLPATQNGHLGVHHNFR